MQHGTSVALAAAIALVCASAPRVASAASISITNASFEELDLADDVFAADSVPGWSLSVTGTVVADDVDFGSWNPPGAAFDGSPLPDGDEVVLVFYPSGVGNGELIVSQTLGDVLEPGVRYDLAVQVGDLSPTFASVYDGFPGARAELRAGAQLVAMGEPEFVLDGAHWPITATYVAPSSLGQLGEPLQIRLVDTNVAAGGGLTWDAVTLTATPVEAYDFALADANGSVSGVFSYTPEPTSQRSIPETATIEIAQATGDLAAFASIDWTSGTLAAYQNAGQYYLSISALGSEEAIEFAIDEPFDLSGPLPLASFSASASSAYLAEAQVFSGSDVGAGVSLTAVPEPGAAPLALAVLAALGLRARNRRGGCAG